MNIPNNLKLFLTVIEQRAAQEGYMINVTYRETDQYVTDFYIQIGHQVFHLWWNLKSSGDVPYGWGMYKGF